MTQNNNIQQIATSVNYKPTIYLGSADEEFTTKVKKFINSYDYELIGFDSNGQNIIKDINKHSPNVLILDTNINESSYIEIATESNKLNLPHIALINEEDSIDTIIQGSPFGYLIKPIDKDELKRNIDVAVKKHNINALQVITAKNRINEKNNELTIEKSNSIFLLSTCTILIISGILARNVTWLQWLLLIPTLTMIFLSIISLKKQETPVPYEVPPFVTIIIPAHNEEQTIANTVKSISEINYKLNNDDNFEIIVANDGSTDNTGKILSDLKKEISTLRIITRKPPKSGRGKGFVLNDALSLSKGEIIGVFDADTHVEKEYLNIIIPYLNNPKVDGVQSRVKMYNKTENFLANMQHVEFKSFGNTLVAKDNLGNSGFLGGNGQFVKKQAIIESGKWDGFAVTEDLNLSVKILLNGGKIRYCGETAVYQEAVTDWKSFFKQRTRWAIGNFETIFIYLPKILKSKISLSKKYGIIEHISFYAFNLFIFFGFIVTIINVISWFIFNGVTIIRMDAPLIVGIISTIAFLPGITVALLRDKPSITEFIKDLIGYWLYCFHLIPLFFETMFKMIIRKERKWDKTKHKG
ncbi:glycosyltransferase [uncultured Methanobrevibacter sp.]|uniref:glycosyltransferase n=1 Tax=uncultured Methanobrevibacter sp. TaxID=253161 RepID=UPI0026078AB5|nr:glycosyltransferase [uncultured Methanobrevibacter sp.]